MFEDKALTFPPQMQGTTGTPVTFRIWNVGTASTTVNSILSFGIFTTTSDCTTLAPGGFCTVLGAAVICEFGP